jgi:PAS domain-containing protein
MEKELQNIPDPAAKSNSAAPAGEKLSAVLKEEAHPYLLLGKLADFLIWNPTQKPQEWADVLLGQLMHSCAANKAALHLVYAKDQAQNPLLLTPLSVYGTAQPYSSAIWLTSEPGPYSQALKLKKTFYQTFDQVNSYLETALLSLKNNALYIAPLNFNQNITGVLELTALAPFPPSVLRLLEMLAPLIGRQLEAVYHFFRMRLNFYETQAIKLIQGAVSFFEYFQALTGHAGLAAPPAWEQAPPPLSQNYRTTHPLLIELDNAGRIANANPNFLQFLGEALTHIIGTPISKFMPEGNWGPDFWQNLQKGQVWSGNLRLHTGHGGAQNLTAWFTRHPTPCGGVAYLLTAFANNPVSASEPTPYPRRLLKGFGPWCEMAAAKAKVGFWRYDLQTREVFWNDQMFKNFGLPPGKVPTLSQMLERIPLQDSGLFFNTIFVNAIAFEQPFEIEHSVILPEGGYRYLRTQGAPALDENGIPYMLVGSSQDITVYRERFQQQQEAVQRLQGLYKAAQTNMAQLEASMQSMLDLSQDFVLIYDSRLNLSYLNAPLRRFLEERLQEPLPELPHFTTLLEKLNLLSPPEIEKISNNLRQSLEGRRINYSFHFQQPSGSLVLEAYQNPVFDPEGNVSKVITVIQRNSLLELEQTASPLTPKPTPKPMAAEKNDNASELFLAIWQRACYPAFWSSYFEFLHTKIGIATEGLATLYHELPILFSQLSFHHRQALVLCLEAILQIRALPPLPNAYNAQELEAVYAAQLAATALAHPEAAAKRLVALGFCFDLEPYLELFSLHQAETIFQCVTRIGQMQRSVLLAQAALQQLRLQAREASFAEEAEIPGADPTLFDFVQLIRSLLTQNLTPAEKKYIRCQYPNETDAYTLCAPYPFLRHTLKKLLARLLAMVMPSATLTLSLSASQQAIHLSFYTDPPRPPLNLQLYPAALETINFDWQPALHFCLFLLERLDITPHTQPTLQDPPLLSLLIPRNLSGRLTRGD